MKNRFRFHKDDVERAKKEKKPLIAIVFDTRPSSKGKGARIEYHGVGDMKMVKTLARLIKKFG